MKHIFSILVVTCTLLLNLNANSQVVKKEISINDLDSLISSKIDIDKISEIGKYNSDETKTRGQNPCERDYDNVILLFKNLRSNYVSCCNGNTNYRAVGQILSSIYSIINNSDCKWGATQWAAILLLLNDHSKFVTRMGNCCR